VKNLPQKDFNNKSSIFSCSAVAGIDGVPKEQLLPEKESQATL